MKSFLHTCGIVIGLVNVALFIFWLSLSHHDAITPGVLSKGYDFDLVSFQIDVLEAVIGFTTILLAVLGFFGFQVVAERAEQKADKAAREVVLQLHRDGRLSTGVGTNRPKGGGSPGAAPTPQGEEDI